MLIVCRNRLKPIGPHRRMRRGFRDGPIAWFVADQGGGFADVTPNNWVATPHNSPTRSSGPCGPAMGFSGSAYYSLSNIGLGGSGPNLPFSVTAQCTSTDTSAIKELWSYGAGAGVVELVKDYPSSGNLTAFLNSSVVLSVAYSPVTGDRTWRHIAFVYDATKVYLYTMGVLAGSATFAFTNGINNSHYRIGDSGPQADQYPWYGQIDDVKWFNYALTAGQVMAEYADPWWRLRRRRPVALAPVGASSAVFRRTLYDRSGSRGVA